MIQILSPCKFNLPPNLTTATLPPVKAPYGINHAPQRVDYTLIH